MSTCDPLITEGECPNCSAAAATENEGEPMSNNEPKQTKATPKDTNRSQADAARDRRAAAPTEPRDRRGQDKSTT